MKINTSEVQKIGREVNIDIPKTMRADKAIEYVSTLQQPNTKTFSEEKEVMENHIQRYYRRLKSQLPDCPGKCTSHGCPDIIVARCWLLFKDHIM